MKINITKLALQTFGFLIINQVALYILAMFFYYIVFVLQITSITNFISLLTGLVNVLLIYSYSKFLTKIININNSILILYSAILSTLTLLIPSFRNFTASFIDDLVFSSWIAVFISYLSIYLIYIVGSYLLLTKVKK
jgi:hypothetical protein